MKHNKVFLGSLFILAAIFIVVTQVFSVDIAISPWKIIVGVVLLAIFFDNLGKWHIFGILFPLAGLYWLFAPYLNIYRLPLAPLIGAVILLSIGISMLFGFGHTYRRRCRRIEEHGEKECGEFIVDETKDMNTDTVFRHISFGKSELYLHSKNLKKGTFTGFCSEVNLFFSDAQIDPDGASIVLECTMGSMKLYIPRTWRVNEDIDVSFGAAQEKNKYSDAQGPLVSITGYVRLGQIEIIYI